MSEVERMLRALEDRLDLPYPERAWVLEELASDLDAAIAERVERGAPETQAVGEMSRAFGLAEADLAALSEIHRPRIRAALARAGPASREVLEASLSAVPFCCALLVVTLEVPMLSLIREGGVSSWAVVFIGLFALAIQARRAVRWFVLRDHSETSLRRHDSTPLFLAGGIALLSVAGCALGYDVVLRAWASGRIGTATLHAGLVEPLSCLIVGGALAALIVFFQGALGAGLRALRVPDRKLAASP